MAALLPGGAQPPDARWSVPVLCKIHTVLSSLALLAGQPSAVLAFRCQESGQEAGTLPLCDTACPSFRTSAATSTGKGLAGAVVRACDAATSRRRPANPRAAWPGAASRHGAAPPPGRPFAGPALATRIVDQLTTARWHGRQSGQRKPRAEDWLYGLLGRFRLCSSGGSGQSGRRCTTRLTDDQSQIRRNLWASPWSSVLLPRPLCSLCAPRCWPDLSISQSPNGYRQLLCSRRAAASACVGSTPGHGEERACSSITACMSPAARSVYKRFDLFAVRLASVFLANAP
jgi:hypothetical protein